MKLSRVKIGNKKKIAISGDEDWLREILKNLAFQDAKIAPTLRANIEISQLSEESLISLNGEFSISHTVICSQCGDLRPLTTRGQINAIYRDEPEGRKSAKNYDLQKFELDEYYFDHEQQIDLEQVLFDAVNLAIPDYPNCLDLGFANCTTGFSHPDTQGQSPSSPPSPFSSLKDLHWKG